MPFCAELPSSHGTARRVSDQLTQTWNRMIEEIQRVLSTHEFDAKLTSINHSAEWHSLHVDLIDRETGTSYKRVITFRASEEGGYLRKPRSQSVTQIPVIKVIGKSNC